MAPFEYLLVLVSILIGLAVADISTSLHRLLRARQQVRWHWLTLAAAFLVVLVILQFWWAFYRVGHIEVWSRYGVFLLLMLQLIIMFLLACAALPDEVPEQLDLEAYYDQNRRYFWTLFGLDALTAVAVNLVAAFDTASLPTLILGALPNVVIAAVLLSLAFVHSRAYHSGLILLLLLTLGLGWFPLKLG